MSTLSQVPALAPDDEADPPFKTGLPGIWEYWSQGCYKEYGFGWWNAALNAVYWLRHHRLAIVTVR